MQKLYEMDQNELLNYLQELEGEAYSPERTIEESVEYWQNKKDFEKSELIRQVLDRWNEIENRGKEIPNYYSIVDREG